MPSQPFVTKKPNSISGTSCLRDLVLTVPPAVSLGETVTLNCSYHLQGENLYAIKLYKGRNEFMTYAAERQPPLRSFPLKGIHIGVRKILYISSIKKFFRWPQKCFYQFSKKICFFYLVFQIGFTKKFW